MCRAEGSVCLRHTAWLQLDRADHLQSTRTWRNHVKLEIRIWAWGMAERKQGAQCHTHSHSLKSSCFLSHIIFKKKSERIKIGNCVCILHFPGVSDGKESACNIGNPGSIPGSGRSPGKGLGKQQERGDLWKRIQGRWVGKALLAACCRSTSGENCA